MSFKVLVIPEDPTNNGYILKPLVKAILNDAGKPNAKVTILTNPKLEGYDHARRAIENELPLKYGFMNLWLFMPDRDRANDEAMRNLETKLDRKNIRLICCQAEPEVEVYACLSSRNEIEIPWNDVRVHTTMKESIFNPLLKKHGNKNAPGQGREEMTLRSLQKMDTLYQFCPELALLRDKIMDMTVG
jgi:hypothetical protein